MAYYVSASYMVIQLNSWQSKATGVVVDFTDPSKVYDNVKQVCTQSTLQIVFMLTLIQ